MAEQKKKLKDVLQAIYNAVKALVVQPDYAQNDSTQPDYIKNRTHYVESVSTSDVWYQTNVEVGSASSSPGAYSGTFNLTEGKTYNVTISQGSNTKTYEGIVCENNTTVSGLFLNKNWSNPTGPAQVSSDAFYILVQASSVILASADVYGNGCTVQVSEVTETIHKLDPKYLPDNVNQLEDITTSKSGKVTTVTFEQTNGTQTQFQVTDGADGTNGKSAYQVAVDNGYSGTEAQWLASLKGADGVSLGEVELTQEVTTATDSVPANKAVYEKVQRLTETDIEDILATGEAKEPTLPFGYTELEWIYNENGSSGIDTGLIPNDANWRFVGSWARMKTSGRNYASIFRAYVSEGYNTYRIIRNSSSDSQVLVHNHCATSTGKVIILSNTGVDVWHTFDLSYGSITLDGTTTTLNTTQGTANTATLKLVDDSYYVKFKTFKAYHNDVLVGNFVPAKRDSDGEIGMYDTVTNTFFEHINSNPFVAGPEIAGGKDKILNGEGLANVISTTLDNPSKLPTVKAVYDEVAYPDVVYEHIQDLPNGSSGFSYDRRGSFVYKQGSSNFCCCGPVDVRGYDTVTWKKFATANITIVVLDENGLFITTLNGVTYQSISRATYPNMGYIMLQTINGNYTNNVQVDFTLSNSTHVKDELTLAKHELSQIKHGSVRVNYNLTMYQGDRLVDKTIVLFCDSNGGELSALHGTVRLQYAAVNWFYVKNNSNTTLLQFQHGNRERLSIILTFDDEGNMKVYFHGVLKGAVTYDKFPDTGWNLYLQYGGLYSHASLINANLDDYISIIENYGWEDWFPDASWVDSVGYTFEHANRSTAQPAIAVPTAPFNSLLKVTATLTNNSSTDKSWYAQNMSFYPSESVPVPAGETVTATKLVNPKTTGHVGLFGTLNNSNYIADASGFSVGFLWGLDYRYSHDGGFFNLYKRTYQPALISLIEGELVPKVLSSGAAGTAVGQIRVDANGNLQMYNGTTWKQINNS